ncbi:MAG: hypothetical protein ABI369_02790 [Acetobacteraceae bacterium]
MGRLGKSLRAIVGGITRSGDRSTLFWWLVDHHDEIAHAADGRRLQWNALCAHFAAAGLTDLSGKPASPATARRTWFRVREMVAEARERQAAAAAQPHRIGATPPSRVSKDWRPSGFRQPEQSVGDLTAQSSAAQARPAPPFAAARLPASATTGAPATRSAPSGTLISPDDPPEVQEQLSKLEARLQQADWFLGQSKRRTD